MLPHHGHDHSRLSELQFETVDQDPGMRAVMRRAVEGRLRKLEQTGRGGRLVVVHGHDEAERERQLAALEAAGRIDRDGSGHLHGKFGGQMSWGRGGRPELADDGEPFHDDPLDDVLPR
jgi:hypothetical protein